MLIPVFKEVGVEPNRALLALTVTTLAGSRSGWTHPAPNGETAVRRSIWLIGVHC